MSRIRGKDTGPELALRKALWRAGWRYRGNVRALPGTPDIVFRGIRTAIFVHGCFWHRHRNCPDMTTPATNKSFWRHKFDANVERDSRAMRTLRKEGWSVITVWECQLSARRCGTTVRRVIRQLKARRQRGLLR